MDSFIIDIKYSNNLLVYIKSTSKDTTEVQSLLDILSKDFNTEQELNIILFFLQYRPWIEVNELITTFSSSISKSEE